MNMLGWNDGYGLPAWMILGLGIGFVLWLVVMEVRDARHV